MQLPKVSIPQGVLAKPNSRVPGRAQASRPLLPLLLWALLLWALLLWAQCGWASVACPLADLGDLQALGEDGREAALQRLVAVEALCPGDADYYALRGALLLHQGRHLDAARDLEHAILLQPRHGGALIDYALTLDALGDRGAARAIVANLGREPSLPPHIRAVLAALDARLTPSPTETAASTTGRTWLRVTLLGGYSTNRNAAPSTDSLTLTLPAADVDVALAPESRPNPGTLGLFALDYLPAPLDLGNGASLALFGQVRLNVPTDGTDGRLAYGRLEAVHVRQAVDRVTLAGLRLEAQDAVPGGGQDAIEVYGERRWIRDTCTPGARIGMLSGDWPDVANTTTGANRLASLPYLDGIEPRLTASLACGATEWSAYVGRLFAMKERVGGDADRFGLRLNRRWTHPLGTLDLSAEAAYLGDRDGFSPLLSSGAVRNIRRFDFGAEWRYPLRGGWNWVSRFEYSDQQSNLDLFSVRQTGIYGGLSWEPGG